MEKNTTQYAEIQKNAEEEYTDKAISALSIFDTDTEILKQLAYMLVDRKNWLEFFFNGI